MCVWSVSKIEPEFYPKMIGRGIPSNTSQSISDDAEFHPKMCCGILISGEKAVIIISYSKSVLHVYIASNTD